MAQKKNAGNTRTKKTQEDFRILESAPGEKDSAERKLSGNYLLESLNVRIRSTRDYRRPQNYKWIRQGAPVRVTYYENWDWSRLNDPSAKMNIQWKVEKVFTASGRVEKDTDLVRISTGRGGTVIDVIPGMLDTWDLRTCSACGRKKPRSRFPLTPCSKEERGMCNNCLELMRDRARHTPPSEDTVWETWNGFYDSLRNSGTSADFMGKSLMNCTLDGGTMRVTVRYGNGQEDAWTKVMDSFTEKMLALGKVAVEFINTEKTVSPAAVQDESVQDAPASDFTALEEPVPAEKTRDTVTATEPTGNEKMSPNEDMKAIGIECSRDIFRIAKLMSINFGISITQFFNNAVSDLYKKYSENRTLDIREKFDKNFKKSGLYLPITTTDMLKEMKMNTGLKYRYMMTKAIFDKIISVHQNYMLENSTYEHSQILASEIEKLKRKYLTTDNSDEATAEVTEEITADIPEVTTEIPEEVTSEVLEETAETTKDVTANIPEEVTAEVPEEDKENKYKKEMNTDMNTEPTLLHLSEDQMKKYDRKPLCDLTLNEAKDYLKGRFRRDRRETLRKGFGRKASRYSVNQIIEYIHYLNSHEPGNKD